MNSTKETAATNLQQLKVHSKDLSPAPEPSIALPEIRLSGRWLEDIGFVCGQPVMVLIEQKKITLTIENE